MLSIAVAIFDLLIGTVVVLSSYVIGRNVQRFFKYKEKLLPLHVWMISSSYLLMTCTFLYAQSHNPFIFAVRFVALVMGIYALWVLVTYQNRKRAT